MVRVFQLRNSCDAILVGIGTVLADDPKLTVKEKYVTELKQPTRVVLDSSLRTPEHALVVNDHAQTLLIVKEGQVCDKTYGPMVEIIHCPTKHDFLDLPTVLDILYEKGIQSILVEGGGTIIWEFLKHKLVDEIYVFIGSMIIGGAQTPTMADGDGILSETDVIRLHLVDLTRMKGGVLVHYQPIQD